MINVRPSQGNRSRDVENESTRASRFADDAPAASVAGPRRYFLAFAVLARAKTGVT